jgi:hypothetical protein
MTDDRDPATGERLDDVTVWPGTVLDRRNRPVSMLLWQPHVRAVALLGDDQVELGVQDLLRRGLRLVTDQLGPECFTLAAGWQATVEAQGVEVRDAAGALAVSMQSSGPGDPEWRDWRRTAIARGEVWLCAGPAMADPATGLPDPIAVRDRGHLVAGSVPVTAT